MKILILEDCPQRTVLFNKKLAGSNEVKIVTTAKECIELLETRKWDALFLDHDLGGETFVPSEHQNTGYTVACWLEAHPEYCPAIIKVHSLNPTGAQRMLQALPDTAVYEPGLWLDSVILVGNKK